MLLRSLIFYIFFVCASVAQAQAPIQQSIGQGTIYENYDDYGVDLTTGFYSASVNLGSIGVGTSLLSLDFYYGQSSGHSLQARFSRIESGQTVTFSLLIGQNVETFSGTKNAITFDSDQGTGAILSNNSPESYSVSRSDGSLINIGWPIGMEFRGGYTGLCAVGYQSSCTLVINSIAYVDGRQTYYNWRAGQNCRFRTIQGGEIVEDCAQFYRLSSVGNSSGYGVELQYASNTDPITYSLPVSNWYVVSGAQFKNYRLPGQVRSGVITRESAFVTNFIDTLGRTTRVTNTGTQFSIKRPGSNTGDNLVVTHSNGVINGIVSRVVAEGVTTDYARSVSGLTGTMTVSYADGGQRVVVSNLSVGRPTSDRDPLGRITSYTYDASGRLSQVTAPEGNAVAYTYDARGNITQTRAISKTPGTPADIVTTATYPATCTNVRTCNKPTSTTDAKGNVTDYAYDAATGLVTSVTQPAASAGAVRPQTRYGYSLDAATGVTLLQTVSTCRSQASCIGTTDETRTTIGYNSNLLPATVTVAGGDGALSSSSTLGYDGPGNLVSVDGPLPGCVRHHGLSL